MRAVVVEKQHGRSKSVKAGRAYVRFLEREVYAFVGSRRNAAGPHFLFVGGPQRQVVDRPQMGRWQRVRRACGQSNTGGTTRERCAGKREEGCFSSS